MSLTLLASNLRFVSGAVAAVAIGLASSTRVGAQDSSPAVLINDGQGNSALPIPGQGAPFDIHTSSTVFSGVRDDQLIVGYNTKPNGQQYSLSEPQIRLAMESNYYDGARNLLEWNLDTVTSDLSHSRRWMYLKVDRSAPMAGQWAFWGTSFSLQSYNSPSNDIPSEYFTATNDGVARLTSRSGQPAQLQLNTTDKTGYPGSYTSLVFQRGYDTKWILNNQGANGDSLALVSANVEVASFSQAGVFASKGQRVAVATKTSSYTVLPSDSAIRADCSARPVAITLPPATGNGQTYRIKKVDASTNPARIVCSGKDTIDAQSSITLPAQYSAVTVISGAPGVWDQY